MKLQPNGVDKDVRKTYHRKGLMDDRFYQFSITYGVEKEASAVRNTNHLCTTKAKSQNVMIEVPITEVEHG